MSDQPPEAVLFDLDGTLVDSGPAIAASLRHVRRCCGLEAGTDDLRWAVGPPLVDVLGRLLDTSDPATIDTAVAAYRSHQSSVCTSHAVVYDGIPELLAGLAGVRLFVATSKLQTIAETVLRHFDLMRYFTAVHGCDYRGQPSPKSALVRLVVEVEGLDPGRTVLVGDRDIDVTAAGANGLSSVAVTYGYGAAAELRQAGANALCDSPRDVLHVLRGGTLGGVLPRSRSN